MLLAEAAAYIKSSISMNTVLGLYGYSPSRNGFLRCPFHSGDKTASLKVYKAPRHGFYCFGCHAGGSVIDFVMLHESCDFVTAVRAMDKALSLNLLEPRPWQEQDSYRSLQACLDELEELFKSELETKRDFIRWRINEEYKSWAVLDRIPKKERTARQWAMYQNLKESLDYQEYRLEKLESLGKEFQSWRNRQRIQNQARQSSKKCGRNIRLQRPHPDPKFA